MKARSWMALAVGSLVCQLAAACGGSSTSGAAQPVAEKDFPKAVAQAVCNGIGPCCQKASFTYDQAQCVSTLVAEFNAPSTGAKYDAQAAGNCVQETSQVASQCTADSATLSHLNDICSAVYIGTKAPGQPCQSSSECAPGSNGARVTCDYSMTGTEGVCTIVTRGKAGDPCTETCTEHSSTSYECSTSGPSGSGSSSSVVACYTNDHLYCSNGTCRAQLGAGQSCSDSNACGTGTFCDFSTQVCAAVAAVGGTCGSNEGCVSTAFCDLNTQKCAAKLQDGASCSSSDMCVSNQCVGGALGTQGVCSNSLANPNLCAGKTSSNGTGSAGGGTGGAADAGP